MKYTILFLCIALVGCKAQVVVQSKPVVNTQTAPQNVVNFQQQVPVLPAYMDSGYNNIVRECPSCNPGTTPLRYKVTYGPGTAYNGMSIICQQVAAEDSEWSGLIIVPPNGPGTMGFYAKVIFNHTGWLRVKPATGGIAAAPGYALSSVTGGLDNIEKNDSGWAPNKDINGNIVEMRDGMGPFQVPITNRGVVIGYATVEGM